MELGVALRACGGILCNRKWTERVLRQYQEIGTRGTEPGTTAQSA